MCCKSSCSPDTFFCFFFFFNDTATTEIYTLSLHDALPILWISTTLRSTPARSSRRMAGGAASAMRDRKSTRLNSSHGYISYAVFCLKKKKTIRQCNRISTPNTRKEENAAERH